MKVFSINPNNGEYFEDKNGGVTSSTGLAYQGTYNYTPIHPLYTFTNKCRFNYGNTVDIIEFYSMLPVKRFLYKYLIEVKLRVILNPFEQDSLPNAINEFYKFCEMNKRELNVNSLITKK